MPDFLKILGTALVDSPLEAFLHRRQRARLARHLHDRANGDNNQVPAANGEYEVIRRVKAALGTRSAVIFDVGANIGTWTSTFGQGLGPEVTIYSFEPSRVTYNVMEASVRKSSPQFRFVPMNVALSDTEGEALLHTCGDLAGANSLFAREAHSVGIVSRATEPIVVTRGESFCQEQDIDHIHFLKIDVEGSELAVLRGMGGLLENRRIDMIQFEYSPGWIDARAYLKDAFRLFQPLGYAIGKLYPLGIRFFERYDESQETFRDSNYLAVKSEFVSLFRSIA